METQGIFEWDDQKSKILKRTRGFTLLEVAEEIVSKYHVTYTNHRYPEQVRSIGKVKRKFMTIVYEDILDEEFIHLITYWASSDKEKSIYKKIRGQYG